MFGRAQVGKPRLRVLKAILLCSFCALQLLLVGPVFAQSAALKYTVKPEFLPQLKSVSLLSKILNTNDNTDAEILAAAQADYQRISSIYYEQGYYSISINIRINGREAAEYSPFDKIGNVKSAEIVVDEGRIFQFGVAQIAPVPKDIEISPEFTTGNTARASVIGTETDKGINAWRENGRPKATVQNQNLIADHKTSKLDVRIQISPGEIARFGTLSVTGNSRMRPNRIRKIAGLPKGQVFTLSKLENAANRLRKTGIFSSVALIEADNISPDGILDITADVVEARLRRVGFGVSVSTDEGASVEGYWLHRNLLGGGEQLRFDAGVTGIAGETDGVDYELSASLIRPATLSPDTRATFNISLDRDVEPNYTLKDFSTSLTFDHRVSEHLTGSVGVMYRNVDTLDVFGQRNFNHLILPLEVIYDTRSDIISANDGLYLALNIEPFLDMKDTHSGARLSLDARTYKGFGAEKDFVLAGRLQLGSLIGPDIKDTPSDFLFYSGGGGTVRGQDFQSLGVTLPLDEISGGKSFIGFSAELRAPIKNKFDGVLFADYGYIGEGSALGTAGDSHAGFGIGVRYATGIGPIRVDLAVPADKSLTLDNVNFFIGIGQAF